MVCNISRQIVFILTGINGHLRTRCELFLDRFWRGPATNYWILRQIWPRSHTHRSLFMSLSGNSGLPRAVCFYFKLLSMQECHTRFPTGKNITSSLSTPTLKYLTLRSLHDQESYIETPFSHIGPLLQSNDKPSINESLPRYSPGCALGFHTWACQSI